MTEIKNVHTSEKGRIKNGSGNLAASECLSECLSHEDEYSLFVMGVGEPWARTCAPHPPGSLQLLCPVPHSPRLYIVSQLDQAERNSVLGAVQLWNHLEALKKTDAGPQP